jgi:DNA processing protein
LAGPGSTVAVVGTGLDRVYPARHRALAHRIATAGVLISEFAPGTPPLPQNFPMRNRIIAGLSRGTLVVEAALQSGSLITARQAADYGREVFALPGSIHSPLSRGCHALIRQGAKLVESADDILEELQDQPAMAAAGAPVLAGGREDPVLQALGHDPATLDALCARTGWSAQELSARLLELELEDRVARLPGGLYQRRSHA